MCDDGFQAVFPRRHRLVWQSVDQIHTYVGETGPHRDLDSAVLERHVVPPADANKFFVIERLRTQVNSIYASLDKAAN